MFIQVNVERARSTNRLYVTAAAIAIYNYYDDEGNYKHTHTRSVWLGIKYTIQIVDLLFLQFDAAIIMAG